MNIKIDSKSLSESISVGIVGSENAMSIRHILILLHGYNGSFDELNEKLPLKKYADTYQLLIVCPNLDNGYYIDKGNRKIGEFLSKELPSHIKYMFSLSCDTELILAGISMGGFGSVLTAGHYPDCFRYVISVAGAFIAHSVSIGDPEVVGISGDRETIQYFMTTFGPDMETLNTSPERNAIAALAALEGCNNVPDFMMVCGTEDLLYSRNLEAIQTLKTAHLRYQWFEIPGGHEFECFDRGLRMAFDFMEKL